MLNLLRVSALGFRAKGKGGFGYKALIFQVGSFASGRGTSRCFLDPGLRPFGGLGVDVLGVWGLGLCLGFRGFGVLGSGVWGFTWGLKFLGLVLVGSKQVVQGGKLPTQLCRLAPRRELCKRSKAVVRIRLRCWDAS